MSGIASVFYRDYKQRITNIGFMFWDLFVPIAYLLLFGTGFQTAVASNFTIDGQQVGYVAFFLPGVVAMTAFGIAMNTSWSFFLDKDSGIFYELLTYPITRRQLLLGKICFNVLLSLIGSLLAMLLAVLVMDVDVLWHMLPLTAFNIVVTTAGWFFLLGGLAIKLTRMDSFNTLTSAAYILFMFMSSLFYPVNQMPAWFRTIAWINPMTWQVDILRYSMLGLGSPSIVLFETFAFLAFTFACLWMAARNMDRAA